MIAVPAGVLKKAERRRAIDVSMEVWIPLVLLASLLGFPIFLLVTSAFNVGDAQQIPPREYGVANFVELWERRVWIWNTLTVAAGGTCLATALGLVLAWILYRTKIPFRRAFELLVVVPYPLGPLVGALAWSRLAAPGDGLINAAFQWLTGVNWPLIDVYTPAGIIFVEAIFETPVAVLMIGAAMQRMDPALEESSSVFGAGKMRTALRVTFPLMVPAIL